MQKITHNGEVLATSHFLFPFYFNNIWCWKSLHVRILKIAGQV